MNLKRIGACALAALTIGSTPAFAGRNYITDINAVHEYYGSNPRGARHEYEGKTYTVVGEIKSVGNDSIRLTSPGSIVGALRCELTPDQMDQTLSYQEDDRLIVSGTLEMHNVFFFDTLVLNIPDCQIIKHIAQ